MKKKVKNWKSETQKFLSNKKTIYLDIKHDLEVDVDCMDEMLKSKDVHFIKVDSWGDTNIVPLKEMIEQITKSYKDKYGDKCDEFYVLKKEVQ